MKKVLLLACLFSAATMFKATAQDEGFHVGLNTGIYNTWILDQGLFDSPTFDHQSTWRAAPIGLAVGYQWDGGSGVQLEVISGRIGQEMDIRTLDRPGGDFFVSGKKEINLNYIQVPLLFKLQVGSGRARFNFHVGPQISFLTKGEDIETYDAPLVNFTGTDNRMVAYVPGVPNVIASTENTGASAYQFNSTAFGALLGLGLDVFVHENVYLSGNLRLGYNFTEIRDDANGRFVDQREHRNGSMVDLYRNELRNSVYGGFQFGVHYFLPR